MRKLFKHYKTKASRNLINIPGWRTNRKIVVIESDDWGSIRMPSREVYELLLKKGIRVDNLSYNRYDSLASEEDLSSLFDTLQSVRDSNGKNATITANTIVANPDFIKIRASNFQEYYYESFIETLKRYPKHGESLNLWREGMQAGVFRPQFHGREHLNINRWMHALLENTGNVRLAFDNSMFDLSTSLKISEDSFMESLNFESVKEMEFQKQSIIEGLKLFEQIFGYKSETFIAPCYTWSNKLNKTLKDYGVKAFQGSSYQFEPLDGVQHIFKKRFHYTGQLNKYGQYYLVRNAAFEPSESPNFHWLNDVLKRAEIAFKWGKPLIVSSHRANYIGYIDQKNKDRNLRLFKTLLKTLVKRWPAIEFMSSDQLLNTIINNH